MNNKDEYFWFHWTDYKDYEEIGIIKKNGVFEFKEDKNGEDAVICGIGFSYFIDSNRVEGTVGPGNQWHAPIDSIIGEATREEFEKANLIWCDAKGSLGVGHAQPYMRDFFLNESGVKPVLQIRY